MGDRQLDIIAAKPDWFTVPDWVPGQLTAIDFVFFRWDSTFDFKDYVVVIESLDTAGPTYRSIGKLQKSVKLPPIHLPWDGRIGVIPNNKCGLPVFEAKLIRGMTYTIPNLNGVVCGPNSGRFQMEMMGVDRPPVF